MPPKEAEIFTRLGNLEQHKARSEVQHSVMSEQIESIMLRLEHLESWKVEIKVTVAKYMGIIGAISLIGQLVITYVMQYVFHKMLPP